MTNPSPQVGDETPSPPAWGERVGVRGDAGIMPLTTPLTPTPLPPSGRRGALLIVAVVGMLSACVSGTKPPDTYVGQNGKVTRIESDREMCERLCNEDYSRCMDSRAASTNEGLGTPPGLFGASGDCRTALKHCLPECKAQ
ncbi:MAG: hypothetical protein P4M13_11235 [Alphaproteobacteria bacterium]|nr:hypothetical protein [Alphaproteobacteria bacterium]